MRASMPAAASATTRPAPLALHLRRRRRPAAARSPAIRVAASDGGVDASTATAALAVSFLLPVIAVPLAKAWLRPRKCSTCLGSTTVTCAACRGRGRLGFALPGVAPAPPPPSPPSLPRCDACEGRGRVGCDRCGRTGLANAWLWKPTDDPGAWGARGE